MICAYCDSPLTAVVGAPGRPQRFCSAAHRKRAWREVRQAEVELVALEEDLVRLRERGNVAVQAQRANQVDALRARIVALRGS